ncbi:PKD domain-containing protein [Halorubrum kocurii]|nr:PKD domain-containing protein [Halorubrum kocurii]
MSNRNNRSGHSQTPSNLSRRRALQLAVGAGVGSTVLAGTGTGSGAAATSDQTAVVFNDQTTPGDTIVLAELKTAEPVLVTVRTENDQTVYRGEFESGIDTTEYTLELTEIVRQDVQMSISLYPDGGGNSLARDTASITIDDSVTFTDGLSVTRVDADPAAGFNYPYFLYVPRVRSQEASGPILVEPNNTGTATDNFDEHLAAARDTARGDHNGGSGREISGRLGVPLLVPAFPRPESEPVDWRHYTHQLDTETMAIDDGDLARIDKQLIQMVKDARSVIADQEYTASTAGIILNGFSASGNFVNRFAALHPHEVLSVSAGGINGTAFLPITEAEGHTLNYQIGAANIEELTGESFDIEAFRDVNQFLYMGALDFNDTLPYGDAWSDSQREIALDVYGPNMQRDRMPYCQSVYEDQNVTAAFKIYEREGHTPRPAIDDIVEFHQRSLADESIEQFNDELSASTEATDPDGDGTFEDINGDGEFTVTDVQKLFSMLTSQ